MARLTRTLKRKGAGIKEWTVSDEHHAAGAFTGQLFGWSKARRFVGRRERGRASPAALGRTLIAGPGYPCRVWETHRSQDALALWPDYHGRAGVAQRLAELKPALTAAGFCLQPFLTPAAALLAVFFPCPRRRLSQHQTPPNAPGRQPGTLRVAGCFWAARGLGGLGRRRGGQTRGGLGRLAQTQTAGDAHVGRAEIPVA